MLKIKDSKFSGKAISIITLILYLLAIFVFEIGYCNAENVKYLVSMNFTEISYNFSLCRIIAYIAFITIYCFTKKIFLKEASESFEKVYKKILLYIYLPVAFITIIIALMIIVKNPLLARGMSIGIITVLMIAISLIYISKNAIKNIIIINFSVGLVFAITTNFNHAIDEKKHFMSAFNIAFGNFKYSESPITDLEVEKLAHLTKFTSIDEFLNKKYVPNITSEVNMEDVPSTPAGYNPITYSFAGLGIFLARIIGGSIIDIYIMGRIFNLILFTILSCIAIKLTPYKKNIFMTIFLMPMTILFAASYSVDGFCIGIISIFIAYCLKLREQKEDITVKQLLILIGIFGITLLAKSMAYVSIGIIILLLPFKKIMEKYKKYIPIIITISLVVFLIIGALLFYIMKTKVHADTRAAGTVSVSGQILNLIKNPVLAIEVILLHIRSTFLNFDWYAMLHYKVFFTETAGNVMLPMLIFILYVSLTEDDYIFKLKEKIILFISFFSAYLMTSMVLYVAFTEVGGKYIAGYQTRYILPILPLALFIIANNKTKSQKNENRTMNITLVMGVFIAIGIMQNILV